MRLTVFDRPEKLCYILHPTRLLTQRLPLSLEFN
jgi:hypothetical protein